MYKKSILEKDEFRFAGIDVTYLHGSRIDSLKVPLKNISFVMT